jgi:hypothetical protein
MAMKTTREDYFEKCVREWAEADKECTRLYMLWDEACARRRRLAQAKNQAWRELNNVALSNGEFNGGAK